VPEYIVRTARAKMPGTCFGRYDKVAILRLTDPDGPIPKMISARAINCAEVVVKSGPCFVGRTSKCQFQRTLAEYRRLCQEMNNAS
jgi:hypothetical protein